MTLRPGSGVESLSIADPDLELAVRAARQAGAAVMESFGRPGRVDRKADGQPLTEADLAADRILGEALRSARPEYGWLSEETADGPERLEAERVWIVDPIDGTSSFVEGVPDFTVCVGLAERGEARLGVVLNPARRILYYSVAGRGAYRNHRPLKEIGESPESCTLLVSRAENRRGEHDDWRPEWSLRDVGGTAWKLVSVAAGEGDGYLTREGRHEWDLCAPLVVAREVGCRVTDADGREISFNRPDPRVAGVVAAGPRLHRRLLEAVRARRDA